MSVQYDPKKDNWWLSVGGDCSSSPVGNTHRSLTNKLLRDRWLACDVLLNARIGAEMDHKPWHPITVRLMKNGEPQSKDVI